MSTMPSFSHHHHHHGPSSIGPLSLSPTHSGSSLNLVNNTSQQCLMQSNAQQTHQLQRDLISPSPYQCHMSVRSGPLTPTASSASTPSIAAISYDSIGLVAASTSSNNIISSGSTIYSSSARHSPCSPSQSSSNLYPLNSNPPTPFGLSNSTSGSAGKSYIK